MSNTCGTPTTKAHVPEEKEAASISAPGTTPGLDSIATFNPDVSATYTAAKNQPVQSEKFCVKTVWISDLKNFAYTSLCRLFW